MDTANQFNSSKNKDRPILLAICLLFSLLLHLLVVLLLPQSTDPELLLATQQPTIVRLIDKPSSTVQKQYELDQQPTRPDMQLPPESSRLAEQNQRVKKETAPKGDDVRDRTARPARMQATTAARRQQTQATPRQATKTKNLPRKQNGIVAPQAKQKQQTAQTDTPLPTLEQLTKLTANTLSQIASAEQAARERIKQRDDVDEGDTVWLNLKRGLLISFFRRFHNQIEGVWNYPREAIINEVQGILLLKITVDTKGELLDVELMKSSGSDLLDYEAIQAVYRAAPFGPLGKHYPHPDLKIMAHFRYLLSGKYIYGKRR